MMSSGRWGAIASACLLACASSDAALAPPGRAGGTSEGGSGGDAPVISGAGGDACTEVVVGAAQLTGTLRDFTDAHPDFEGPLSKMGFEQGIVASELGSDDKPVYAGNPTTLTTNGVDAFNQWYRDASGINEGIPFSLTLTKGADGVHRYDDPEFFPIDGQGFGNQGLAHNYHFTLELRTQFLYRGGEVFTFHGDDDLFVFIHRRLAIDLGGVHTPLEATVALDDIAPDLGLTVGGIYDLHFFFAERHTTLSDFHIETTIGTFVECDDAGVPR